MRAALQAALAGRGGLVLVGGEAGIGKTTLVHWLAAEARRQGALVLEGHCYDLTQAPPYGPWREALAANGKEAPELGEGTASPFRLDDERDEITSQERLFAGVRICLAEIASQQPTLLILEDLHWSDPASLALLRVLARDVQSLSLLVVATYRVDALTRQHPLFALLPHLVREAQATRIELSGLDGGEIGRLIAQRYPLAPRDHARLATYLQSRAGGNPLFLTEVLRALEGGGHLIPDAEGWTLGTLDRVTVPPLVEQIIESRLAGLDEATQRLLETAAVIGEEVSLDLLADACERSPDDLGPPLEQALAAHFLRETASSGQLHFTHALVRDALYVRQTSVARRAIHRRVAELLANRADPPLSVIASHFAAGDDPLAISWLVRAGEQALSLYAARDAVAALTRAHHLAARFAETLPTRAYHARAAALALLGEFDGARHDRELVLQRARAEGDHHAEWQALLDLGTLWGERDYEQTGRYSRAALELARASGDEHAVAHSLNRIANWHVNLDEPELALPLHGEALAIFEARGETAGVADTLDLLGMASYLCCNFAASTAYCERAIALFRELDDRPRLASSLTLLGLTGGNPDGSAVPIYREAAYWIKSAEVGLKIAQEIGWFAGEAFAHFALCLITALHGQFGRALDHVSSAETFARRIDHHQWMIAAQCGWASVWIELLDWERADSTLELGLTAARVSGFRFWINLLAGMRASVLVSRGDLHQAAALLNSVSWTPRPPRSMGQRQCWQARAELHLARHEPEGAMPIIETLCDAAPDGAASPRHPWLLKLQGDACMQLGRADEAERVYLDARNSATLFGFRSMLWKIDAARAHASLALGRGSEAADAVQHARVAIEALATTIPDETIQQEYRARALGQLPATETAVDLPLVGTLLSPRELDVLRLIVEGLSDREIAETLSISPRTVMRHVTGILTKLNVPSRTAAATLAMRRQIV